MSKNKSQLSIANEAVSVPGVAFTRSGVLFAKRVPIERLNELAAAVTEMHGGTAWWLGDIGLEIQARKREENEESAKKKDAIVRKLERELEHVEGAERKAVKERIRQLEADAAELRKDGGEHYTAGRAEVLGVDAGYWKNCVMVCRFLKPSQRCDGLGIGHHHEAIRAAGGVAGKVADAQRWLNRAEEGKWPLSEMRRQVNISLGTAPLVTTAPFETAWAPLESADKWATAHREDPLSPEQARTLLVRWGSLLAFVEKIKTLAAFAPEEPSISDIYHEKNETNEAQNQTAGS